MGNRIADGAGCRESSVLWLVLREVLVLLVAGLLWAYPAAYVLRRYVSSQLFGITPTDLSTCALAMIILGVVAAVSGYLPARCASAIDPLTALLYE